MREYDFSATCRPPAGDRRANFRSGLQGQRCAGEDGQATFEALAGPVLLREDARRTFAAACRDKGAAREDDSSDDDQAHDDDGLAVLGDMFDSLTVSTSGNTAETAIVIISSDGEDDEFEKENRRAAAPKLSNENPEKENRRAPRALAPNLTPAQFRRRRSKLAADLFSDLNARVFGGQLPSDLKIEWSMRLHKTAGLTYSGFKGKSKDRVSRIELASKVVTDAGRLRQTLAHELCHAAAWVISGCRKPPHGKVFKSWARRVQIAYPDVRVTTCHSYAIQYKYRWTCTNPDCSWEVKRHSKSVDVNRHVCGRCRSRITLAAVKGAGPGSVPRKVSAYQIFQKEQFARLKAEGSTLSFQEKSKLISARWKVHKARNILAKSLQQVVLVVVTWGGAGAGLGREALVLPAT